MAYLRIAVTLFSLPCFLLVVSSTVMVRRGRYSRRVINLFLAGVCATVALLFTLVCWPWVALPWALSALVWLWSAVRYS